MNINCFSKEKKMEKKSKKIFVPKMKGGLWKDGGEVLKSGRMGKVRKMLDKARTCQQCVYRTDETNASNVNLCEPMRKNCANGHIRFIKAAGL